MAAICEPKQLSAKRSSVGKAGGDSAPRQPGPAKTFDDILLGINPLGLWQKLTLVQCVLSYVAIGLNNYAQSIFVIGRMDATCTRYSDGKTSSHHYDLWLSNSRQGQTGQNGELLFNVTELYNLLDPLAPIQVTDSLSLTNDNVCQIWLTKHQCQAPVDQGGAKCVQWKYTSPYYISTMQSEWNLVCDDAYKVPLFQAIYQIGFMLGMPVVGNLADWIGRRSVVWLAWPFLVAGYATLSQSPFFWVAAAVRFVQGTLFGSYYNAKLILNMEMTVPEKRNLISVAVNCTWPVAAIIISIVAYYVRSWRMLQLICIAPALAIIPCILLLPESPRWLVVRGKLKRAVQTLKRGARLNRRACPNWSDLSHAAQSAEITDSRTQQEFSLQNSESCKKEAHSLSKTPPASYNPFRGMAIFFTEPQLRYRSLLLLIQWFVVPLVFFGIVFYGTGVLPGSPHLKFGLMSIARLVTCPLQLLILNRFGAKHSLIVMLLLAAASLLTIGLISPRTSCATTTSDTGSFWTSLFPDGSTSVSSILTIILLVLGNCLIDVCFAALYVITDDIYPTEIRQTGFSLCSTIEGLAAAIAPFAADMIGLWWRPLPAFVFGGACAVASLAALLLPNQSSNDKVEDAAKVEISAITTVSSLSEENAVPSGLKFNAEVKRTSIKRQAASRRRSSTVIMGEALCWGTMNPIAHVFVGGALPPIEDGHVSASDDKHCRKWHSFRILNRSTSEATSLQQRSTLLRTFSARLTTAKKPGV